MKKGDKKKDKEEVRVYLCPKCRSKNVQRVISLKSLFGLLSRWRCKKCGYEDLIFPLLSSKKARR